MDRKEASDYIRNNPTQYLRPAKKRGTYICPICNNGTGATGDGITTKDGVHFSCWKCHEIKNADILDIIGLEYGLSEYPDKLNKAMELYGIDQEATPPRTSVPSRPIAPTNGVDQEAPAPKKDYAAFIKKSVEALKGNKEALEYLRSRGLSESTIEAQRLGYTENNGKGYIVLPYSDNYYILRGVADKEYRKPKSDEAGKEPLFNSHELSQEEPVFIVEAAFCAISINQVGGHAVALGTTGTTSNLDEAISAHNYKGLFILSLDNDQAGKEGQERLKKHLEENGISYIEYNIAGECKDPNEQLQKDPESLKISVNKAIEQAKSALYGDIISDNVEIYAHNSFYEDIEAFKSGQSIKTGFSAWDFHTGGLYNGLYFIGAISSLGKTTLMHQLADQLAQLNNKVIYFSLEQSKMELLSKSLSREIYKKGILNADSLSIRKGEVKSIGEYLEAYTSAIKGNMNIIEGSTETDIDFIRDYVDKYIKYYNARPVVIIDYLQIIANTTEKDPRAKVEANVKALKILSRDYKVPVLCISNINRSNYTLPVDFESFKESGLIEYSADVILGLQLQMITSPRFQKCNITEAREEVKKAMTATPREVKLVCLKNRYGARYEVDFNYYPKYDYLEEKKSEDINPFTGETTRRAPFNAKLY